MLLACIGVAGYAMALILNPAIAPPFLQDGLKNGDLRYYFHFLGGSVALVTGTLQFSQSIRNNWLNVHRWIGRVYLTAVLLSGGAGLIMAYSSAGNLLTDLGFGLLGLFWLITGTKAYTAIRNKNVKAHKIWMIRNYALTLAAVSLRIYLPLSLGVFQFDFQTAYMVIAWACWVPNLVLAEFLFVRKVS